MQRIAAVIIVLLSAGCQSAGPERADETAAKVPTLSGAALQAFIVGKSLRYSHYGATSTYFADGSYGYRDYEVRDAGAWSISGDAVCIFFAGGGRRCDRFALIGSDYYRIEEGGRQTKVDGIRQAEPSDRVTEITAGGD